MQHFWPIIVKNAKGLVCVNLGVNGRKRFMFTSDFQYTPYSLPWVSLILYIARRPLIYPQFGWHIKIHSCKWFLLNAQKCSAFLDEFYCRQSDFQQWSDATLCFIAGNGNVSNAHFFLCGYRVCVCHICAVVFFFSCSFNNLDSLIK